ncbi:MAG: arginine repressor [Lachnospiraceae bacterium]|nr:arginine repressor [Lachnospiraceae bacterium]
MKIKRHNKIIELISNNEIETQEELADLLMQEGHNVTQATVSRDIRELKLSKVSTEDGKQKYAILNNFDIEMSEKYIRVLKDGYLAMEPAQNIVVIRTVTGMGMAVATAIDILEISGIVGCIAGDDTVFCAIKSDDKIQDVMEKLGKLVAQ